TQTDSSGQWALNLGNVRTSTLDAYYRYSSTLAQLGVEVQCSPLRQGYKQIPTGDAHGSPNATISVRSLSRSLSPLGTGWNFVTLPQQPVVSYKASQLCSDLMRSNGGLPVEVLRWESGGWNGYVCGVNANDFALDVNSGYFVRNAGANSWAMAGDPIPAAPPTVVNGWNAISSRGSANASDLCAAVVSPWQGLEVNRWFAGGWDGHICGRPFNDFASPSGQGYFFKAGSGPVVASRALPVLDQRGGSNGVQDVRVTNVRDTSVTISWQTEAPGNSLVEVLLDGASVALAEDVRGPGTVERLHYVVVDNLRPDQRYTFSVQSVGADSAVSSGQGTFATFATLNALPRSHSAYGRIVALDGVTPVANALVSLRLHDEDGRGSGGDSLVLSAMTDGNGYWYANLGNARQADGGSFSFSASDDSVGIEAFSPGLLPQLVDLSISDTFPASNIALGMRALYMPSVQR
ncbi:MAG: fibronectin type III domain-containing protein, partial [Caldilineaceae bacterium]